MQEVCNALFDALFHILPLGETLDKVEPTPARLAKPMPWDDEARDALEQLVEAQPYLVRISAAKRLRDLAEQDARNGGAEAVSRAHVLASRRALAGSGV